MKTQVIGFFLSNYIAILVVSMIIVIAIFVLDKHHNKIEKNYKVKNNFLPQLDLKSSRIGAVALIILILIYCLIRKA